MNRNKVNNSLAEGIFKAGLACLTALSVATTQAGPPEPQPSQPDRPLIQLERTPPSLMSLDKDIAELALLKPLVKRELDELVKAADPLKKSREEFRTAPTDANTTKLLADTGKLALAGVNRCQAVAEFSHHGSGLEVRIASCIETNLNLLIELRGARECKLPNTEARGLAISSLETLNTELDSKGVTQDQQLSPQQRLRITTILRTLRETELANKIGGWSSAELNRAIKALEIAKASFLAEALSLRELADDYESFARSFSELGVAVSDVTLATTAMIGVKEGLDHARDLREQIEAGKFIPNAALYGSVTNTLSTGDGIIIQPSASASGPGLVRHLKSIGDTLKIPSFAK